MEKFDKLDIADEMLESAIESYLDGKKYFSALHLAGAAQEIYGKWIRINGGKDHTTTMLDLYESSSSEVIDRKKVKNEDKRAKNTIKHFDNKDDRYALLNPNLDSFMLITEAVTEYIKLERNETPNIIRFKAFIMSTRENGL